MRFYKDIKEGLEDIVVYNSKATHINFTCKKCGEHINDIPKSKFPPEYHAICGCGHEFNIIEEKRENYRKDTSLDAEIYLPHRNPENPLPGTVSNISRGGLQLKSYFTPDLTEETKGIIGVKFTLDNTQKEDIQVQGKICYVNKNRIGYTLGISFTDTQPHQRDIAFYLFN